MRVQTDKLPLKDDDFNIEIIMMLCGKCLMPLQENKFDDFIMTCIDKIYLSLFTYILNYANI